SSARTSRLAWPPGPAAGPQLLHLGPLAAPTACPGRGALARPSIPVHGCRSGDSLRTLDGACRSGRPRCAVGSGGLRGPAVRLDAMLTKQLPQALDFAVQALVLLDDGGKVHPGRPLLLPLRQPRQQLLLGVAQRCGPVEV